MLTNWTRWLTVRGDASADTLNLRRWFACFLAVMLILAVAALSGLALERGGYAWGVKLWVSALYVFYMALCCSFFPAPTAWIVLLMASPVFGLVRGEDLTASWNLTPASAQAAAALITVTAVAALGAAGTTLANLNEYHIFTFLLRFGRIGRIRTTALYDKARRYFAVSPFGLMTAVSFLPIPVDVVRWLAITYKYRRDHFAWANYLGRFARYALLALTAFYLKLGAKEIILVQLGLIGLVALRYLPRLWKRFAAKPAAA